MNWYKKVQFILSSKSPKSLNKNNKNNKDLIDWIIDNNRWVDVDSSWIKSISYYRPLSMLEILLKNNKVYTYLGVPPYIYNRFIKARSKGEFFNKFIRNKYTLKD